eukprot:13408143-Alexandrium_andersonii.AAC.1
MNTLFGRRPDGGGCGGRLATAASGSTTASPATSAWMGLRRTRGSTVAAWSSARDQRSEAGRRWIPRASRAV